MPTFQIEDNGGAYEIDAPDERSAVSAFRKMQGGGGAPAGGIDTGEADQAAEDARIAANDPGHLKGIGAKLLQGATFGLGDEALAGIKTGFGFLGDYGQQVAREREILSGYEEAHPVISALSEIVGSLPTAGGIAKAGGSLVLRSAGKAAARNAAAKAAGRTVGTGEKIANAGKRLGAGATEGAAYGAAYGAGTAEGGPEERAVGALEGAPAGAALGAAIPAVTSAVGAVARPVGRAIEGWTNPAQAATRRTAEVVTPRTGEAIARGARVGENLGIADVGKAPAQDLLSTAGKMSGERGTIATRANLANMSAVDRIKTLVGDSLAAPEGAYQAAKTRIMDARSSAADPYYKRFHAQPVEASDELTSVLSTPAARSGLAAAKRNAANRRESALFEAVDDDGNIIPGKVPNAQALDETKRVMDSMEAAAKAKPDGSPFAKPMATPESRAIAAARDALVKHMDTIGDGSYAKARAVAGANIDADKAIEFGRKALTMSPSVIAARLGRGPAAREKVLSGNRNPLAARDIEDERSLAKIGLAEALFQKLEGTGYSKAALQKIMNSPADKARLRPFFDTDAEFRAFQQALVAEARKARTNEIARRATTGPRSMDTNELAGEASAAGIGRQAVMWGPKAAALSAISKAINRVGGMTPKVADEIGRQLMERDPREVKAILQRIHALERTKLSKEAKRIRTRQLVTGATAGAAGRAVAAPSEYQGVE